MLARHMNSKNGGISGNNIIIVDDDNNKYFQSYEKVVAKYYPLTGTYEILDEELTRTTTNYLGSFIKICSRQNAINMEEIKALSNVKFVNRIGETA